MKKYISLILTIFFLLLFGVYFFSDPGKFKPLLEVSLGMLILISITKLAVIFFNGLFIKVTLKSFDKQIGQIETFYISLLSSIGNYFTPMQGGASIRAIYLKKKYQLPYSHFLSTLSGNYIISFLINSSIGLLSLVIVQIKDQKYSLILYIFYIGLFLTTLFLSLVQLPQSIFKIDLKFKPLNRFLGIMGMIVEGWNRIIRNKKLLLQLINLTLANFLVGFLMIWLEFHIFNIHTNLYRLVLYNSLTSVTLLIGLTPGSIGIREAVILFSSFLIGITNAQVLQIAVIDRGVTFFVLGIMFVIVKLIPAPKSIRRIMSKTYANKG